jgi:hypothetical protein
MPPEDETPGERAYPYWAGWGTVGCAIVFFGLIGGIGVSLFPTGYEKFQAGELPTGIALMVIGIFGLPTLGMAVWSLIAGVRDTLRPPVLRVTAEALVLPIEARGEPPQDEHGEPIGTEPPQPETVPFAAIRRVTRGGPRRNEIMEVAHDLSEKPLQIKQHMMRVADFDELEKLLRTAVPGAFANTSPRG